jgi:tRNA threonylcarbamoyladenosine biosynthesis protein TsaE
MNPVEDPVQTLEAKSLEELPAAAAAFRTFLAQNHSVSVVIFEGEMGAGKTTFIKAICRELGVTDAVSSPTFSIVNEYETTSGKRLYHFDFYRIEEEQEALDIGTLEYFDSGNLCLIEWPSKVPNLLPEHYLTVNITASPSGQRTITLKTT